MDEIKRLKFLKQVRKLDSKIELNELNEIIKKERVNLSERRTEDKKQFRKNHKRWFLLLDIAIISIILMNMGALLLTNALVMKVTPDIIVEKLNPITNEVEEFIIPGSEAPILREANPVVAQRESFIQHPEAWRIMYMFFFFGLVWSSMTWVYVMYRNNIKTNEKLNYLTLYVIFYGFLFSMDFINDLGFWIGKMIFS